MAAATSFVGRAQELALIAALFERGERLITLLGPGGIGKTRLALRHAGAAAIVCDLAEATTAAAMCEVLCDALDVTLGPRAKLEAAIDPIGHVLAAHGDTLVVLDNFEQLVEPGAHALARWLELAPAARFLVTSRERLKLAREVVLDVGPLELATDAVALFVDRARAACATWRPTAGDAAAIAEIVRRLDGFPLAIELAAPRCRVLSPAELAAGLADGLGILDRGPRDGAARHATLAGAIAWSFESLRPAERAALAQCTVFRGGFGFAAAEAVLDGGPVIELLQALADKSLVTTRSANGAIRFDLYASIRELASRGPEPDCEARHAAYYVALGERGIAKAPGSDGRRLIELERENLVAAHARAAERIDQAELAARAALVLDEVLAWRGPLSANLAMLDAALAGDRAAALPPALLARVLEARGRALDAGGDGAAARAELERALALAIEHGDRATEARTRSSLCVLARKEHRLADAVEQGTQALALCRALGDVRFEAFALGALGAIALERGELAEAGDMMTRARDIALAEGDRWVAAMTGAYLGHAHHETGQLELAAAAFDEAVSTFGALGDRRMAAVFSLYRVMVDHELGELERARAGYELAIAANHELELVRFEGLGRACSAAVHAQLGDAVAAAAELDAARGLLARAGDPALVLACELHALHAVIAADPAGGASRAEADKRGLVRGNPLVAESDDVRFAMRILAAAVTRAARDGGAELVVGRDGRWFRIAGAEVSLARHRALRLLVLALAETRVRSPGRALDWEALLAIGWPGERVATGGAHRVQVAIATLRRRGLHDVLARRDDGYLLDPRTPVELATIDDV